MIEKEVFVRGGCLLIGLLVVMSLSVMAAPLDAGRVLHFHMNNQSQYGENDRRVHDFSPLYNEGYVGTNEARWNRSAGVIGDGAFEFDGYNDKITIPDADSLSVNTSRGFTFAMWVNVKRTAFVGEGSGRNYLHFAGKGGYGNDYEYVWRQYNRSNSENRGNRISFYVFNLNGGLGTGSYVQEPITLGQWVHYVGVVNKTHVQLWKNGVLKDADPLTNYDVIPGNGNAPLNLGTSDGDSYFRGALDEVRIYHRALNKSDIQALYQTRDFGSEPADDSTSLQ